MTSAAQVSANRSNAQKSTGPRTPEGKAAVAQNAVRHGLLAREVVIKGEDPGEFEFYRDAMLGELAPAGQMESMLAQRIVGLSWRLRRAERLQAAAFDKAEDQNEPWPALPPEVASRMLAVLAEANWHPPVPPARRWDRGVQDFSQERVLDRLLVYERRIEHSLYRTMAELRKLRKEGGITSSMGVPPMSSTGILPVDLVHIHGRDAHATEPPGGGTMNGEENESCETKRAPSKAGAIQQVSNPARSKVAARPE